jgi:PAS domain S-box-containing protein
MAVSIAEDGTYLDVNDAMLERLGYELEDMVGRKPEAFATPETAERIVAELRPALRRRGKLENKPFSLVTVTGEVVDCVTNAFVEYDQEGQFLRTVAMYSEFSDQARANFKYRTLYRSTPAMLHTVDGDGLLITVTGLPTS